MFGGGKLAVGLVIRDSAVEVIALRGRRIAGRARVPFGSGDGQLATAIQRAAATAAVPTKRLAVSVPSREVLFRFFTIPLVPKAECDAAVQFEARKYIPFKMDQLVWDYRAIPSGAPNRLDVVFAAMPLERFRIVADAAAAAGIQPQLVEPQSLSLARLVEPTHDAGQAFVCLVDVTEESAHIAIVRNQLPYMTRDVDLLPRVSPSEPAAAAGASESDATAAAVPQESGEAAVDPKAQRLLSELSVSMDFFMREHPSTTIARVVLFGEHLLIGPWCRWLAEHLACPVELGTAALSRHVEGELPLSFASAVGLALLVKEPAASLDFLKRSLAKGAPGIAQAWSALSPSGLAATLRSPRVVLGAAAIACLLGVVWSAGRLQVVSAHRRLQQLVASRPEAGVLSRMDRNSLQFLKEQATAQVALLQQTIDGRISLAAKLDALARTLPEGIWLTGLSFDYAPDHTGQRQPRLVLQGACRLGEAGKELAAIQAFEEQVESSAALFAGFRTGQIDQIKTQADPKRQYTYQTFQLNCSNGERVL